MERMSLKNSGQEDCTRREKEREKAAVCAPVVTLLGSWENDSRGFMGVGKAAGILNLK